MRNDNKKRERLYIIVSLLVLSVLSLSIVYAALSTTLKITGSAEVTSSNWSASVEKLIMSDIEAADEACSIYNCVDNMMISGDAKLLTEPKIEGTTISGIEISMIKPNDVIALNYRMTNTGDIPMKYTGYTISDFDISSVAGVSSDVEWAVNNFSADFEGGITIDGVPAGRDIVVDDIICPGDYLDFFIVAQISDVDTIPTNSVTISNINFDINFVQADKSLCS